MSFLLGSVVSPGQTLLVYLYLPTALAAIGSTEWAVT